MNLSGDVLYPRQLCLSADQAQRMWFSWFTSEAAFFHCVLAMAEGQNNLLIGSNQVSPRMLRYLSNTYRCINNNLEKGKTPSNATVAAVMSICMHHQLLGETGASKIHLDALDHMVGLRGGIEEFSMHLTLLHKICR